jgi:long-chain acyl-CoA synthetase
MNDVPPERPWFRFWPQGVPRSMQYPQISLHGLLSRAAAAFPEKLFLKYGDARYSFSRVNDLSGRFAASLVRLGLRKGERVMLFMPNAPEFAVCFYGVLRAGGVVTAANPMFKAGELRRQMEDSGASAIVIDEELLGTADSVLGDLPPGRVIVSGGDSHGCASVARMLDARGAAEFPAIDPAEDVAVIQYTGGTTGMPRGAMMTHRNLVANALQNATWFSWTSRDVVMGTLPFYHTWGACVCLNSPLWAGCPVMLMRKFDPAEALAVAEKERASVWYGAATMFNMLLREPSLPGRDLSSLRYVKAGAMPIPEELRRQWNEVTGVPLMLGYGLSEASPETHNSPPGRVKPGTVGIPIVDTDARIVDPETGEGEMPPGEQGELVIRGPQVMKGYWRPDDGEGRGIRNGWLHTGDIAVMDEEGYFSIKDRKKDLIKYKGYSIAPAELESVLFEHPAVWECAVIGVAHPDVGEIPRAYVVRRPGCAVSAQELMDFCGGRIAAYKKIREVEFTDEIPKNHVGKVLRRLLREREKGT